MTIHAEITPDQIGTPVFAGDAIKASYRQTANGISVTFLINEEEMTREFSHMMLGTVCRLFVTLPEMGA